MRDAIILDKQSNCRRWSLVLILLLAAARSGADQNVRVATYNIKFLKADAPPARQANLTAVIADLQADVIALQEIEDRAALERVFPPAQWTILIDDDSGDDQDVALVVNNSAQLNVAGFNADLDADDSNFLFPDSDNNSAFPNHRDVLFARLELPDGAFSFHVLVHHAKARAGGRLNTTPRRALAAQMLVARIQESNLDEQLFILLGDFNDSPDDQSLNILETGDLNAGTIMETEPGDFLINLTERLFALNQVTFGVKSNKLIKPDKVLVDIFDTQARTANFNERNSNSGNFHKTNFLDNILIPHQMISFYVADSVTVFNRASAVQGNNNTRASDHLPVYADFIFPSAATVRIVAALPNPAGPDAGHETITLLNSGGVRNVAGWILRDRAGSQFALQGSLAENETRTVTLPAGKVPLNNNGDEIQLIDDTGRVHSAVSYTAAQVAEGVATSF